MFLSDQSYVHASLYKMSKISRTKTHVIKLMCFSEHFRACDFLIPSESRLTPVHIFWKTSVLPDRKVNRTVKEAFSVLTLYMPVFIFTSGSSAHLGHPRCGLSIWFYSIQFSEFMPIFSWENGKKNTKALEARHFRMIPKWPPTVKY